MKLLACVPLLVACGAIVPPPRPVAYYIASIRTGPGALAAIHRCALDARGTPTGECYDQYVGANSEDVLIAEQAMRRGPALPANPQPPVAESEAPRWPGVAPDVVAAMQVVNGRDVRSQVAACQRQYGTKPLPLLRFSLDIAATGEVEHVALRGDLESFVARCTSDVLQHARFSAAQASHHYELAIAL